MRTSKREKLFHTIAFFVENTKACHKVKLFKLLYFLDFEIYRQTGRSTTGMLYFAWPMGPVPVRLHEDIEAPPADMRAAFVIRPAPADDPYSGLTIRPRMKFDESLFTRREMAEMRRLAEIHRTVTGDMMKLASHERGLPWRQIYEVEGRHQELIPYDLILDDRPDSVTKERADEIEREGRAVAILFK